MANDDILPSVASVLYDITASGSYTTGGTSLGEKLSAAPVGFRKHYEFWGSPGNLTPRPSDARYMGIDATLVIVLAEKTTALMALAFQGQVVSGGNNLTITGVNAVKFGQFLGSGGYRKLVLRPVDASTYGDSFVYFPRALVTEVGPVKFGSTNRDGGLHMEAAQLTIVALHDETFGVPFAWGDPDEFPSL